MALFEFGRTLVREGRYAEACPKFEASFRIKPGIGTRFNLADCWEHVGKLGSAWTAFQAVASDTRALGQTDREQAAKERARALEPRVARLAIDVPDTSRLPAIDVTCDGKSLSETLWSVPVPIDAGPHVISAKAKGRRPWQTTIVVADGSLFRSTVPTLEEDIFAGDVSTTANSVGDGDRGRFQRTLGWVVAGGGALFLGLGGLGLLQRESVIVEYNDDPACPPIDGPARPISPSCSDRVSRASTWKTVAEVSFVTGGALTATGVILLLTAPSRPAISLQSVTCTPLDWEQTAPSFSKGRMSEPHNANSVEQWAEWFVRSEDLTVKLSPPAAPRTWAETALPLRIERPGRPPELVVRGRTRKSPSGEALRSPEKRAQLIHTFLHHELQAAELMAWAILAFPHTPRSFRMGLLKTMHDEIRHMALYRAHLSALGFDYGSFRVRDWFWERVPSCPTEVHFTALMGIGFEGGNLDHTRRFADAFRAVGDEEGAALHELIGEEEIPHVRFALAWFRRWTSGDEFTCWREHLPSPLTPMVMRGDPIHREARQKSGMTEPFVSALAAWTR